MILDLLRSDGSIVVNKTLAQAIGINAAVMYSELISKHKYFSDRRQLTEDGFFYNTVKNMQDDTTLSKDQQLEAIKVLKGLDLIDQTNRGLPRTRHFKVNQNEEVIKRILSANKSAGNPTTVKRETRQPEGDKSAINNNKDNNTNKNTKEKEDIYIPYSEIIDYLNEKANTKYKDSTQKTRELIKHRWKEGFTLDDFKAVIDNKTKHWLGSSEYAQYLRPVTLFGTKFESYLNQKVSAPPTGQQNTGTRIQYDIELPEFKSRYGKVVMLTSQEYDELVQEYGDLRAKKMIEVLDNYIQANGKNYDSHYAAIKSWVVDKVLAMKGMSDQEIRNQQILEEYNFPF